MRAKNETKLIGEAYADVLAEQWQQAAGKAALAAGKALAPHAKTIGKAAVAGLAAGAYDGAKRRADRIASGEKGKEDNGEIEDENTEATSASFGNKKGYDGPWKNPDRERPDSGDAAMEFDRRGFAKNTKAGREEDDVISQLDVEAAARDRLRKKYGEDKEEEALPSENFDQSYAIFINGDSIPGYLDFIQQKGWKGVGVMKAAFDHKLGVIVIPPELDYDAIEGELFKIQSEKEYGQFWGQRGIGYKGKKWIPVGGATEDNEEPRRGISGYEHKPDALVSARQAGAKHKPYVSSFVSDGGKIFGVMGSDGKIVHKTRDKQKAYKWFRDNYDNI